MTKDIILIAVFGFMFVFYLFVALKYTKLLEANEEQKKRLAELEAVDHNADIFKALAFDPKTPEEKVENSRAIRDLGRKMEFKDAAKLGEYMEKKVIANKNLIEEIYKNLN